MQIVLLSVGKRHDALFAQAIDEYSNRINRTIRLNWEFIVPSGLPEQAARKLESTALLAHIKKSDTLWLLDEIGGQLSSPALAQKLDTLQAHGIQRLVFVIGGAYGVDNRLNERADFVWSLSRLVFPHQIVRLLAVEQLYRALEINKGTGYHHA